MSEIPPVTEDYPVYEPTHDLAGYEPKPIYTEPNEDFSDLLEGDDA